MPTVGDTAPEFTNKVANGDVESVSLGDVLGEGPVVLAFFPGAFTPPCSNEMVAFEGHIDDIEGAGGAFYGLSADSPFSLNAFREEYDLSFPLVSDMGGETISAYDLEIDIEELGLHGVANRAVFVLDDEGEITYEWTADSPENEPDYEDVLAAVEDAA